MAMMMMAINIYISNVIIMIITAGPGKALVSSVVATTTQESALVNVNESIHR